MDRVQNGIDARDNRGVDLAAQQRLLGQTQGHDRRGAGGIHRDRRAAQIQRVRDTVGDKRQRVASHQIAVGDRRILRQTRGMGHGRTADKHAYILARKGIGRQTCIFQRLPRDLQEKALLRIHLPGFARRDAEGCRVERPQV